MFIGNQQDSKISKKKMIKSSSLFFIQWLTATVLRQYLKQTPSREKQIYILPTLKPTKYKKII